MLLKNRRHRLAWRWALAPSKATEDIKKIGESRGVFFIQKSEECVVSEDGLFQHARWPWSMHNFVALLLCIPTLTYNVWCAAFPQPTNQPKKTLSFCRYLPTRNTTSPLHHRRFATQPTFLSVLPKASCLSCTTELPLSFFGIFDGHGGNKSSTFAADR